MAKKQLKKKIQHSDTFYIARQEPKIVQSWYDPKNSVNKNRRDTSREVTEVVRGIASSRPEVVIPYNGTPVKDKATHVSYIGGDKDAARKAYWEEAPIIKAATDSIAGRYGINPELLRNRLDKEGFTDEAINLYNMINKEVSPSNRADMRNLRLGYNYLNREVHPKAGVAQFGLDDATTYINSGLAHLINESWNDGEFTNEKGRVTNAANGASILDNMGIMASLIRGFRDQAAQDFPNATPEELDNYANIYYNRGITGGRNYINNGNGSTPYTMAEGGSLHTHKTWDDLSLTEKAAMMKVAVRNGITSLNEIKAHYNEFAEGGDTVEEWIDAIYQNNPKEEFLGEPEHHYDFTQPEEWADAHGYYPDARGHRDDRVKKPAHPSHPSRGIWEGDKFVLSELGMQNPNYTLFGLNDGGQDPQAILTYNGGSVIPEVTVTPNGNYIYNPYDNIKLHYSEGGNLYGGGSYLDKAKAMIRANEGWRSTPYKDAPKGKNWRSVGYGFNDSGFWEKYPDGISKHYEKGMTKAQAEQELAYYLGKAERQLRGIYGKRWDSFNDDQKAAILDTYYQRPASVGSKSGFYSAVMAGRDGAPYLGVRGFGDRNQSRRDLYRGRGVSAPMTFDTVSEPVSAEPEMISFKPLNPQAFDNPMFTYTPPTLMEEPVQVNPLAEAYSPKELERQEKKDNLERFNMFMSMLSSPSDEDTTGLTGMLGAMSMLSGNKKAEGGNIFDGDTEPTQQMQQGYIRQRPEGTYFYDVEGQPEIDVTPLNTSLSSNPADWSFTDALGKIYSPHRDTVQGTGELREGSQEGPILSAVNNYLRELNWRAKNDPSSIALQGKYTIPAIAATGLLPWLGEAAAATNVARVPLMTWADVGLTAGFGAHGLNHWLNEGIDGWGDAAMTALEVAPLGRLARPMWNEAALAIENYRYPLGRPQVPEGYLTVKPQVRTRIGDVEIDNPQLFYRQGSAEMGDDFIKSGVVRTSGGFENPMYTEGALFKKVPTRTKGGLSKGDKIALEGPYSKTKSDLLVTDSSVDMIPADQGSGKNYTWFEDYMLDPFAEESLFDKSRVPLFDGTATSANTTVYRWEPGYGYRRIRAEEPPAAEWAMGRTAPEITAENAASITPEQWTAAQDAAIARGDMTEAQRLRDLHFKVNTPNNKAVDTEGNPLYLYHGSPERNITTFDPTKGKRKTVGSLDSKSSDKMNFFTSDDFLPEAYIENSETGQLGKVYSTYVNMEKPLVLDYNGRNWNGSGIKASFNRPLLGKDFYPLEGEYPYFPTEADAMIELRKRFPNFGEITEGNFKVISDDIKPINSAIEEGLNTGNYDSAIIKNVAEAGQGSLNGPIIVDDYVSFGSPNQIKLADAVTYDDKGVRIPLGKRDNFNINDIRYGLLPFGIGLTGYGILGRDR